MSGDTVVPGMAWDDLTIPQVVQEARKRMSPVLWDFASGASETEVTLRRNAIAMESIAFRPMALKQALRPELATRVLGVDVSSPVLLAPIGSIASFHPEGAVAPVRAAKARGVMSFVGTLASPRISEVAARSEGAAMGFQIYVRGDRTWLLHLVRQAEEAGYSALCLTVDSSGASRRERDIHNRYRPPRPPRPNIPQSDDFGTSFQRSFTWDDLAWLRAQTSLPLALKGIMSAPDARLAVEHGVDAVYVSNHGGRELDHLPSTIEVLAEVVSEVAGRAEVLVDSGFTRGTDVVKALAMGASAVLLGKLQIWALAAGGVDCLIGTLKKIDDEIRHAMRLLGAAEIAALSPHHVRPSFPTVGATSPAARCLRQSQGGVDPATRMSQPLQPSDR